MQFLATREQTLEMCEIIRLQNDKKYLTSSRDKESDGFQFLSIGLTTSKL